MEGLTIGRNVHFVAAPDLHYPMLVTYVWNKDTGMVNLGGFDQNGDPYKATSVVFDESGAPWTWHWIERA